MQSPPLLRLFTGAISSLCLQAGGTTAGCYWVLSLRTGSPDNGL
jgi:hypothetical protein